MNTVAQATMVPRAETSMTDRAVRRFPINVPEEELVDLRRRMSKIHYAALKALQTETRAARQPAAGGML